MLRLFGCEKNDLKTFMTDCDFRRNPIENTLFPVMPSVQIAAGTMHITNSHDLRPAPAPAA